MTRSFCTFSEAGTTGRCDDDDDDAEMRAAARCERPSGSLGREVPQGTSVDECRARDRRCGTVMTEHGQCRVDVGVRRARQRTGGPRGEGAQLLCSAGKCQPGGPLIKSSLTHRAQGGHSADAHTQAVILDPPQRGSAKGGALRFPLSASARWNCRRTTSWVCQRAWRGWWWTAAMLLLALLGATAPLAAANTPPRFVLDGQSEIVVRLTEGEATPVGKYIFIVLRVLCREVYASICVVYLGVCSFIHLIFHSFIHLIFHSLIHSIIHI